LKSCTGVFVERARAQKTFPERGKGYFIAAIYMFRLVLPKFSPELFGRTGTGRTEL
jgi:hypothetical protein